MHPERPEIDETDGPYRQQLVDSPDRSEGTPAPMRVSPPDQDHQIHRILFLDDDQRRAVVFLERNPEAIWIQTAEACIAGLAETWDEVYLDHDLGGEHFVDVDRPDCGMEVVRWLCKEPRAHLNETRFIIHSHNLTAALMMVLLMRETGYNAEFLPFGFSLELDPYSPTPSKAQSRVSDRPRVNRSRLLRFSSWLAGLFGPSRKSDS